MTPYEQRNRDIYEASGGAIGEAIKLDDGTYFYSRGWYGCDRCHGPTAHTRFLQPFLEVKNRVQRSGWRCGP